MLETNSSYHLYYRNGKSPIIICSQLILGQLTLMFFQTNFNVKIKNENFYRHDKSDIPCILIPILKNKTTILLKLLKSMFVIKYFNMEWYSKYSFLIRIMPYIEIQGSVYENNIRLRMRLVLLEVCEPQRYFIFRLIS